MNLPLYFSDCFQTCSQRDIEEGEAGLLASLMRWTNRSWRSKDRLAIILLGGSVWAAAFGLYAVTIYSEREVFNWWFESSYDPILPRTEILTSTRIWDYIEKSEYQEKGLYYSKDVKFDLTVKRELTEISNFCENQNCTSSAIQSARDNSSIYYFYQSVPFEEFIKTNLTITCDYVIFSPVYAKKSGLDEEGTNQYTVFSDWIRFHYADLPFSCFFLFHLPVFDQSNFLPKERSTILTLLSIANGVIVSRKSSGVLFDRSVMGPFGLRKHSHSHLVPWMVLTDLDMIITNNKKSLQTLLDKVEGALTRPAVVQNPNEPLKSLNDIDIILAAGHFCRPSTSVNAGLVIMRPTESVFILLARIMDPNVITKDDQGSMVHVLRYSFDFHPFGDNSTVDTRCRNSSVWSQAENNIYSILKEQFKSNFKNDKKLRKLIDDWRYRERGHAVVVSPRWMNANGCRRDPYDDDAFRLRTWRPGDWQAHFYGCGHPTEKDRIDFFIDALKNDSSNVDFPRQLEFYNWSAPDAFKFRL